jgi:hypothetical protein
MKRLALLAALAVAGCASEPSKPAPSASYRDLVLADAPLAYYEFTDGAADATGRHPGSFRGGVTPGQPSAHPALGKAILLDGTDGRMHVPAHADFRAIAAGAVTVELWFCTRSGSRGDLVNYKCEEGARDFGVFSCLGGENEVTTYENLGNTASASDVPINAWHHVAFVRDGAGTVTLYVDGAARDTGTGAMSWDFDADLLVGCNHVAGDVDRITIPFDGWVDEVAIYRSALSKERVLAHFAAAGGRAAAPLAGKPAAPASSDTFMRPPVLDADGFERLDSLDHFRFQLGHKDAEPARTFRIDGDAIVCRGAPAGYMYTRRSYGRFTLRFEWRYKRPAGLDDDAKFGGNSGYLLFITAPNALGIWPRSIEVQGMNRDAGHVLPIPRGVKCKWTVDEEMRKKSIKPVGEWNAMEIAAMGTITVSINGMKVATITECELTSGPIGFQSEGAEIHWRAIRIRDEK